MSGIWIWSNLCVYHDKYTAKQRSSDEQWHDIFIWSDSGYYSGTTNHTIVGQGRIIKAFPEMKHRYYHELIQELRKNFKEK